MTTPILWHTDPSLGDPDDDYTAAVLKALVADGTVDLLGAVVNRRPALDRAHQFAATLAALGVSRNGHPLPIGVGADSIGRPMGAIHHGAPDAMAPAPVDARQLQYDALSSAADHSVVLLVTTALTDVDLLMSELPELVSRKVRTVVAMSDARRTDPALAPAGPAWEPGDATNNRVDVAAAERVFARLQSPAWLHVTLTIVSRWAVFDGGELPPAVLAELAGANPVASWLRDRAAASLNDRWTDFNHGRVEGRDRASFVAAHLGGHDPGRTPEQPIFDLVTGVPIYDAVAAIAAVEPWLFAPAADDRSPNVRVIGINRTDTCVRNRMALNARLTQLLRHGFRPQRPDNGCE